MRVHERAFYRGDAVTRVLAGCKINLGLRITGVRPNGYHEIDSLFVPVPEPKDELIIL